MNVATRLAWNSVVAWVSSLAAGIGGFVLVRFLIDRLGIAEYGVAELLDTLVVFTMLSDLGLRAALGRHLTEQIARADHRRINELLSVSALCYVGIAALLLATCWILAEPLTTLFRIEGEHRATAVWMIRLFVPTYTLAMFVGTSFAAIVESHHRFDIVDSIHAAEIVLRLAIIFGLIGGFGWGLTGWAAGYLIAKLLAALAYIVSAWRLSPTIAISPRYLSREAGRELFALSGLMLVYQSVVRLSAQADPFILSSFLGPTAVGLYRPAFRVTAATQPFIGVVNRQLRPMATHYFVTGRRELLGELLARGTKVSLMLSLPFAVFLIGFAHPLVRLWLGDSKFEVTAWLLVLWTIADLAAHVGNAQFFILLGMNRMRFMTSVQSLVALVNVAVSIGLVAWLVSQGASRETCVLGIIVPTLVLAWGQRFVVSIHAARETGISVRRYFVQGWLPPLLVGAVLGLWGAALHFALAPDTWLKLALAGLLIVAAWAPLIWWFGFDDEDRRRVRGILSRRKGAATGELPADEPIQTAP